MLYLGEELKQKLKSLIFKLFYHLIFFLYFQRVSIFGSLFFFVKLKKNF